MMDIYFESNYGKLYEEAEHGKAMRWSYTGDAGTVSHMFIIRRIPELINNETYFDIVTPYGYGGPIIEQINNGYSKKELVSIFQKEFEVYCIENKIVSEFIRFHPIVNNGIDFKSVYDSICIRNTVGTNLRDYNDPVSSEFSKGCRKNIRQAINKGISWRITKKPDSIDVFKDIYYSTMDRNNAVDYYYFNDNYFQCCLDWFKDNIILVEAIFEKRTIAASLCFIYDKTIHIHLSGTLSEYLYLSPAYILRYAATLWGKENGYEVIHHGGGRSNAKDDSLFTFKKQFGQHTLFDFYVGKRIWNQKIYDELVERHRGIKDSGFFPAYRG